jgi:predicted phosphoribosyltransferase
MSGMLSEDPMLRDRTHVFEDRDDAGRCLAEKLVEGLEGGELLLAIPSGGVPVGAAMARVLSLPLELVIVRKVQIPGNPEAGFGAVDPDGHVVFNEWLIASLGLSEEEVREQVRRTRTVINRRESLFRGGRPEPELEERPLVLVDDGLASGYTMLAALRWARERQPSRVTVAVPTGHEATVERVMAEADRVVCLNVRGGFGFAVADAYRHWHDLCEEEVIDIIRSLSP